MIFPAPLLLVWSIISKVLAWGPLAGPLQRIGQALRSHAAIAAACAGVVLLGLVAINMIKASGGNAVRAVVAEASTKAATDHIEHTREINRASAMERARLAQMVQDQAAKISALEQALSTPAPVPANAPASPSPVPPVDTDPIVFPRSVVRELRK